MFLAGIDQVAEEIGLPTPTPPASLIGVDYLFEPDVLVEIEATAVIDSVALVRTSAGALASQLSPFPAYRRRDGIDERDWSVGKGSPCGDEFAHGALNPVVTDRAWAVPVRVRVAG